MRYVPRIEGAPTRYARATFATFDAYTPSLETVVKLLRDTPADSSLTLLGPPGTGKTHLAFAWLRSLLPEPCDDLPRNDIQSKGMMQSHLHTLEKELYKVENMTSKEREEYAEIRTRYGDPSTAQEITVRIETGKALLAAGVGTYAPPAARFVNAAQLYGDYLCALADKRDGVGKAANLARDVAQYPGVLIIDDLGTEAASDAAAKFFTGIISRRYDHALRTIVTSNLSKDGLMQMDVRIPSRLREMGPVVTYHAEDYRGIIAERRNVRTNAA